MTSVKDVVAKSNCALALALKVIYLPLNKRLVRKRTRQYGFLKSYLDGRGFTVYPSEIIVGLNGLPQTKEGFFVDVAAFKDGGYYAFEYKSLRDSIGSQRLLNQICNYSLSFDYVMVVAEVNENGKRREASINPKRGSHMQQIISLGAGFWTVHLQNNPYKHDYGKTVFTEVLEPKLQHPNPDNKRYIEQKFKRYVFGLPVPEDPNQKTIEIWMH